MGVCSVSGLALGAPWHMHAGEQGALLRTLLRLQTDKLLCPSVAAFSSFKHFGVFLLLIQPRAYLVAVVVSTLTRAICRHHHQRPGQRQLPADIRPLLHRYDRASFPCSQVIVYLILEIALSFTCPRLPSLCQGGTPIWAFYVAVVDVA